LKGDAERVRSLSYLFHAPAKADQALVERFREGAQDRTLVALGIDGNEQRLDVLRRRADLVERVRQYAETRWAKIGAMGVAQICEQPLSWEIRAAHDAAVGIRERQRLAQREVGVFGCH